MLLLKLFTLLFIIDAERINSLCMWKGDCFCAWKGDCLCNEKVIASVDPGRINDWCRGSTVNFHMKNSKDLTYFCCMLVLKLFTLLFTIDTERINSQLSHGKFKRFNLSFLHVGIKTLYITVYNWCREDQQSLHVKRHIASACEKVITSAHEKVIASVCEKVIASVDPGDWWSMQRGSTVNFQMKNSKDLTYFFCMLVLKLFTIDAKRINSLSMWWRWLLYVGIKTLHVKRGSPLHV